MRSICLASILLSVACSLLPGQIGTEGAFFGTVTDSTGSSVPGAEIVATHLGTGLAKQTVTDVQGNFSILALPIGRYSVTVKAKGFKTWEVAAELTVGDRSRLSPALTVGDTSESVTVSGNSELLQTEKSSAETVVQMQQIRELPLDTRNPLALVSLVPGMRYVSTETGGERGTYVQGQGLRQNRTEFLLDGFISNAPMDEGGTGIPNVDAIAEFSVEMNFSAENGRDPMQVKVATKSGTNEFHGAAWEFNQNDFYNARNTFALTAPRVRRNQFGGAVGGPVRRNKTFFYGNFEGTVIHNAQVWNTQAVTPAMEQGDFSALKTTIIDPLNKAPFPGNLIPQARINSASTYFLPKLLVANSPGGLFKANAGTINDTWEGTGRVDHQITPNQRIYGRYVTVREPNTLLGYEPSAVTNDLVAQHNAGVNYTWMMSANTVLTLGGGMLRTRESYTNAALGVNNDALSAGIQGFPTAGREQWIGPPNINFASGYQGISFAGWGVPGALYGGDYSGKADLHHVWHGHTIAAGVNYTDVHTYGDHGSGNVRGTFNFTNLYTGDGFADYLLGYTSGSARNAPLAAFGTDSAPYGALFVNDSWRIRPNFTLDLGLRYERWFARHDSRDAASTWDPALQKVVAANQSNGSINLNAFLTTPNVAQATANLWVTARQAGYPDQLWESNGNWGPHVGLVYRPASSSRFVIRSGYGMYYNAMTGNRSASAAANLPFWGVESISYGPNQLQSWQSVWSTDPNAFGIFSIGESQDPRIRPARTHEWNATVQTALPSETALTLSYVGTKVDRDVDLIPYNDPSIGPHANLQADRPDPLIGSISRLENYGRSWYHGIQTKVERRFSAGIAYTFSYSFSRSMAQGSNGVDESTSILSYSPAWYNRGRTPFDYRHLEYATLLWEIPFGQGKKFHPATGRLLDAVAGGWNFTLTEQGRSGTPFSVGGGPANLGNGNGTRVNLVGDPHIANPSPSLWFNTSAFALPALYTFGSAPLGILEGPGLLQFNTALSKQFRVAERKTLQFRWEAFNAFNRVNYSTPSNNISSSLFGRITSANTARYMQLGLKFLF
ncbi:MAG TPA: carboxypeptidase regulatory-like domain-containing protein [Bryobacteraceae bacterium]|nr:carboxypeptidase regulatory-like domain-containing protein [Bryobacteraceae bacterium]